MSLIGGDLLAGLFGRLMRIEQEMEAEGILEMTGEDMLVDIQERIGHQQDGWPDLAEGTQAERVREGYAPDEPLLETGALRDAYVVWRDGADILVGVPSESDQAVIAEVQEFGDEHVPPRPVVGPVAAEDAHLLPERVRETIDRLAQPR